MNSGPETNAVLLSALKQAGKNKDRWKGTIQLSWIGAGVGLVLGVGVSLAIHFTGLDKLWQFEDESGSPLHFLILPGFVIAGMLMGAKDVGPTIQREKLESLIKRYDLDTTRLLDLAKQHGLSGAEKVLRELRQRQS
ncbi:hypothetical protein [Lacipirellula parvula]|uniref:hypothetical protein n=1 Tax=Lacipirellula parvula TaxID=2650471 RepID=UPI00126089F8|nr:hypothetical protein [Lacipirellula parvula]